MLVSPASRSVVTPAAVASSGTLRIAASRSVIGASCHDRRSRFDFVLEEFTSVLHHSGGKGGWTYAEIRQAIGKGEGDTVTVRIEERLSN